MIRLAVLPLALAVSACVHVSPPPSGPGTTPSPAALADTSWRIVRIDGAPPVSPKAALRFEADRLGMTAGCNGLGGTWRLRSGRLIGGPYASTMMYCEGLMEQERALAALLEARPAVFLSGDRLVLRSAEHSAEMVRVR
jgi:heat shock protein HslJ